MSTRWSRAVQGCDEFCSPSLKTLCKGLYFVFGWFVHGALSDLNLEFPSSQQFFTFQSSPLGGTHAITRAGEGA